VQRIPTATDAIGLQFTPGTHDMLSISLFLLPKKVFCVFGTMTGGEGKRRGGGCKQNIYLDYQVNSILAPLSHMHNKTTAPSPQKNNDKVLLRNSGRCYGCITKRQMLSDECLCDRVC
jgi:hypothetical protein